MKLIDMNAPLDLTKSEEEKLKNTKTMLRSRLFYMSHPSLSSLECSINLSNLKDPLEFFQKVLYILSLENFDLKQIEIKDGSFSVLFKEVSALKLLNLILKEETDHPLYPIYLNWINGAEWMANRSDPYGFKSNKSEN
jgi:hypothetical protein